MTILEVPNLKEEIDRKAHETLEWLIMSSINDKITDEQFSIGVDVLFMALSGLAGRDFIELITKAEALAKNSHERVELMEPPTDRNDNYGVW